LLKTMLRSNSLAVTPQDVVQIQTKSGVKETSEPMSQSMPPLYLSRQAARALASFHAEMSEDDLQQVYRFLQYPDNETKMDGLKALRAFNAPGAVPLILPLLQDPNQHVVRDACRTLAVLGDKSVIPSLQPLVKNPNQEISRDASDAILMLQNGK
jgi:HEAT repeat protein